MIDTDDIHTTIDAQGVRHISVQGDLWNDEVQRKFLQYLHAGDNRQLDIAFFSTSMLPIRVIEELIRLQQPQPEYVKITAFHRYLHNYLFRMGVRSTHPRCRMNSKPLRDIKAVGFGGSAGSLEKFLLLFRQLPASNVPLFVVQHVKEDRPNQLEQIIRNVTRLRVVHPEDDMPIKDGCVYIAPSACHMQVENRRIRLRNGPKVCFAKPSIQVLFESLATTYAEGLIAVLLCGYGEDGVKALPLLKEKESTIIIEDPSDDEANHLLHKAWSTGQVDYKFPLPEIISFLRRNISLEPQEIGDSELTEFLEEIFSRYGYDYRNYVASSVRRRIARAMAQRSFYSFSHFRECALADEEVFEDLFLECSINVTEFFRDPALLRKICELVLPYLDSYPYIRIWSAGCSTGEEAVSLAIMLEEMGMLHKSRIYASDINPYVIQEAKNGLYTRDAVLESRNSYATAGGTGEVTDYFESRANGMLIRKTIHERILYLTHSLLNTGALNSFHLIVCRNVLIYFNQPLQKQVMALFDQSLEINGFLALGEKDSHSSIPTNFKMVDNVLHLAKKQYG